MEHTQDYTGAVLARETIKLSTRENNLLGKLIEDWSLNGIEYDQLKTKYAAALQPAEVAKTFASFGRVQRAHEEQSRENWSTMRCN